ncbi:SIR2 family protein [Brachybacterium tyrofermentans]|uniref:SIR2 family protein n=1 Tax=Brachybacterium tyrofermentans TaxID=47848 RepID=UPI003FCF6870
MEPHLEPEPRPVYVLGAGFSRAISAGMPLMNELGDEVKTRLPELFPGDQDARGTFEDWLSLRVTALPFLNGWQNSRRAADAERMIAEIAEILDDSSSTASSSSCPKWLIRLVKIWHAERAVVITFNYDTLVERAINEASLAVFSQHGPSAILADQQVFPAPPAPPAVYHMDNGAATAKSLQLLKLHGSLNWYWSSRDSTGSTLTRIRERSTFEKRSLVAESHDFTGVRTLDRFLIPPVSMKNSYYTPHLTNTLWRTAHNAIRAASKLTLLGYSMPKTDQIGVELLSGIPESTTIEVVDVAPGLPTEEHSLASRVQALNGNEPALWAGYDCIEEYVAHRTELTTKELVRDLLEIADSDVLISAPLDRENSTQLHVFSVVRGRNGALSVRDIDFSGIARSPMPPREMVLNSLPEGMNRLEDFVRAETLGRHILDGGSPIIATDAGSVTPLGVERVLVGPWEVAILEVAPCHEVDLTHSN